MSAALLPCLQPGPVTSADWTPPEMPTTVRVPEPVAIPGGQVIPRGRYPLVGRLPGNRLAVRVERLHPRRGRYREEDLVAPATPGAYVLLPGDYDDVAPTTDPENPDRP